LSIFHDNFHLYFLERELIVNHAEQLDRAWVWHVRAMHLNPGWFVGKLRMLAHHFAVEQK